MSISQPLRAETQAYLASGDRKLMQTLRGLDRSDRAGQAVVRYLMQIKHWPTTPNSEFSAALDHLFAHHEGRAAMDPQEYRDETSRMILEAFDYECVVVVPEPRPEPKSNPGKVTRRPRMVKEQDTEGSLASQEPNMAQAGDRLKKVIAIQRGQG